MLNQLYDLLLLHKLLPTCNPELRRKTVRDLFETVNRISIEDEEEDAEKDGKEAELEVDETAQETPQEEELAASSDIDESPSEKIIPINIKGRANGKRNLTQSFRLNQSERHQFENSCFMTCSQRYASNIYELVTFYKKVW